MKPDFATLASALRWTLLLCCGSSFAQQNLIPNPDFEETAPKRADQAQGFYCDQGRIVRSTEAAHAGAASLKVGLGLCRQPPPGKWIANDILRVAEAVPVQPGQSYLFKFWARHGGISLIVPALSFLDEQGQERKTRDAAPAKWFGRYEELKDLDWTPYELRAPAPEWARGAKLTILVVGRVDAVGEAWLDDLCFGTEPVANLIENSGFEIATLPDFPDHWQSNKGCRVLPGFDMVVDKTVARSGDNSMRFDVGREAAGKTPPYNLGYSFQLDRLPKGDYVWSAWLKSDPPGLSVCAGARTFTLTGEWQRYHMPFPIEGLFGGTICVWPAPPLTEGRIWIDDVMLHRGKDPLPYAPSEKGLQLGTAVPPPSLPRPPTVVASEGDLPVADLTGAGSVDGEPPPVVDGRLVDPMWARAFRTGVFRTFDAKPAKLATTALVAYDARNLYVAFDCADPETARKAPARHPPDDANIWDDDLVEVFIQPDEGLDWHYQFVLSLGGCQWDTRMSFQRDTIGSAQFVKVGNSKWNGLWSGAVARTGAGWQAEIAIPWANFSRDLGNPSALRINLAREVPATKEYTAWSPTYGNFNSPWRFGRVRGLAVDWQAYKVWIEGARLDPLLGKKGQRLSVVGTNGTNAPKQLAIRHRRRGNAAWSNLAQVEAGAGGTFRAKGDFKGIDSRNDLAWETAVFADGELRSFKSFVLQVQEGMRLIAPAVVGKGQACNATCQIGYPAEELRGASLRWHLAQPGVARPVVAETIVVREGTNDFAVDTDRLTTDEAELEVAIIGAKGKRLASRTSHLRVVPAAASVVTIDPVRQALIVDGRPFLPIALYYGYNPSRELIADARRHNCNTIFWEIRGAKNLDLAMLREEMIQAGASGLRLIPDFSMVARFRDDLSDEACLAYVAKIVRALKDLDAIIAWHTVDEPASRFGRGLKLASEANLLKLYAAIKQEDPCRPVIFNMGAGGCMQQDRLWAPAANDAVMTTTSYTFPINPTQRSMGLALTYVRMAKEWADRQGKPVFNWLDMNHGALPNLVRLLRPVELRCQMYMDVAAGSRGLFLFAGPPPSPILWEAFARYAGEIAFLQPALFAPAPTDSVHCESPEIVWYAGKQDEALILIAVNPTARAQNALFKLAVPERPAAEAELLFEERAVEIRDAILKDVLQPYGAHVYRIRHPSDRQTFVEESNPSP